MKLPFGILGKFFGSIVQVFMFILSRRVLFITGGVLVAFSLFQSVQVAAETAQSLPEGVLIVVQDMGVKLLAVDTVMEEKSLELAQNPVMDKVSGRSTEEFMRGVFTWLYSMLDVFAQLSLYFWLWYFLYVLIRPLNTSAALQNGVSAFILLLLIQVIAHVVTYPESLIGLTLGQKMRIINPVRGLLTFIVNIPQMIGNAFGGPIKIFSGSYVAVPESTKTVVLS